MGRCGICERRQRNGWGGGWGWGGDWTGEGMLGMEGEVGGPWMLSPNSQSVNPVAKVRPWISGCDWF